MLMVGKNGMMKVVKRGDKVRFLSGEFREHTDKVGKIGIVEDCSDMNYGPGIRFDDGRYAVASFTGYEVVEDIPTQKFNIGEVVRVVGLSEAGFDHGIKWPVKITGYDPDRKLYKAITHASCYGSYCNFPESSLEPATIRKGDWVEIIGESVGSRTSDIGKIVRVIRIDGIGIAIDIGGIYNESSLKLLTEVPITIDGVKYAIPINKYQEVYNLITTGGQ